MLLMQGIDIDRSTLAFWVGYAAAELRIPVAPGMSSVLATDVSLEIDISLSSPMSINSLSRISSDDINAFTSDWREPLPMCFLNCASGWIVLAENVGDFLQERQYDPNLGSGIGDPEGLDSLRDLFPDPVASPASDRGIRQ